MITQVQTKEVSSFLPNQIHFNGGNSYFDTARKSNDYVKYFFSAFVRFFRDQFYFPLKMTIQDPFFINCDLYTRHFVNMITGNNSNLDPTFPLLPKIIKYFSIKDVPVIVELENSFLSFKPESLNLKKR